MNDKKNIAHIVNHTHWDREWRYPIWETRLMLVEFIDELLELMEKGTYEGFLMDGQVIPILDYLEIRPENKSRIETLVASGKLEIGPWYTLPDEFPVDGEALVRNLLWGLRYAERLGKSLKVGYTSFGWGQTAQLPQIYNGFGIDTGFIGKRVSHQRAPKTEFIWKSPDGSQMLTSRFGVWGRQNFYFFAHLGSLFGIDHLGDQWYSAWSAEKTLYHGGDNDNYEQDYFRLEAPDKFYPEKIDGDLADLIWKTTDESLIDSDRLMMNGCDYSAAQPLLAEMIERINHVDRNKPTRVWKQSTLSEFVAILKAKISKSKLTTVEGELRDGPAPYLTGNALMTRNYIKFLNKKAQNLLIRFAEPLSVFAAIQGVEYPSQMLDQAWDNLLKSHPHDSINAVTQDDTAHDVVARLQTVVSISRAVGTKAIQNIVKMADLSGFDENDVLLMVVNPLPYERKEMVSAWVDIPTTLEPYPHMMPSLEGLIIADAEGNPKSTQWLESYDHKVAIQENHTRAFPLNVKRHKVVFDTGVIPAGGYKIFKVDRDNQCSKDHIEWSDQWSRTSDLVTSSQTLENQYLKVEVNADGSFDLTDKQNNKTYARLNYYEDHGENGNYWANERPHKDQTYCSLGANAKSWTETSGPLLSTIVTQVTMDIPVKADFANRTRSEQLRPLVIQTFITLKAESRQVDVRVEFENCHKDHCLRVLFPTGITKADHVVVGEHFNAHARSIRPQGPGGNAFWTEMGRLPFHDYVDISDGQQGFAVINDCLTEYEVSQSDHRILALTLLRSVRNSICTELRVWSHYPGQDGGQCLGRHVVSYAICPHSGRWDDAEIDVKAQLFNAPVRVVQTNKHTGSVTGNETSFFSLSNRKIRFSALKKAERSETMILRLYNPSCQRQTGTIKFNLPVQNAWQVNLNEERQGELPVDSQAGIAIDIAAKKIATFELSFIKPKR